MGFNGYPHNILQNSSEVFKNNYTDINSSLSLILNDTNQLDAQSPLLLRGVEWVFSWVESAFTYSITIAYESNISPIDITNLEHFLWSYDSKLSMFFFLCVIQDLYNLNNSIVLPYLDNWYNYINMASSNIVFFLEHPEHKYFTTALF